MEFILYLLPVLALWWLFRVRQQQQQRVALLARLLAPFNIEQHAETILQGYQRALGESNAHRRDQVLAVLRPSEQALSRQMELLAQAVQALDAGHARVSKLPVDVPVALGPGTTFDLRALMRIHARGIAQAVEAGDDTPARDRAFAISAEVLLMQHSCHWFCRSKNVASARLRARHRTDYQQVLASVLAQTRSAYLPLTLRGEPGAAA